MDRAIRLHAEIIDRVPAERDLAIKHLEELHDGKFGSIALQFAERHVRSDKASEGAKHALDAALLAQKELVAQQNEANSAAAAKGDASFTKQIDEIGTIIQSLEKALDARITELKERIDRGEGSTAAGAGSRTGRRLDTGQVLTTLSVLAAVIGPLILGFRNQILMAQEAISPPGGGAFRPGLPSMKAGFWHLQRCAHVRKSRGVLALPREVRRGF